MVDRQLQLPDGRVMESCSGQRLALSTPPITDLAWPAESSCFIAHHRRVITDVCGHNERASKIR